MNRIAATYVCVTLPPDFRQVLGYPHISGQNTHWAKFRAVNIEIRFLDTIRVLKMLVTKVNSPYARGPFFPAILNWSVYTFFFICVVDLWTVSWWLARHWVNAVGMAAPNLGYRHRCL